MLIFYFIQEKEIKRIEQLSLIFPFSSKSIGVYARLGFHSQRKLVSELSEEIWSNFQIFLRGLFFILKREKIYKEQSKKVSFDLK